MSTCIFCMMMMGEQSGIVKAPEPFYEAPDQPAPRADYFSNVCTNMKSDAHYTGILLKITAAEGKITTFREKTLLAISGGDGKVGERNVAQLDMDNEMDYLLVEIFKVGNSNPTAAIAHYQLIGVSWYEREGHKRPTIDVKHGDVSGSFYLYVGALKTRYAAYWQVSTDPEHGEANWKYADFSHCGKGYIAGLTKGVTYYFRAKTSSKDGKSDWTQIFDITCL